MKCGTTSGVLKKTLPLSSKFRCCDYFGGSCLGEGIDAWQRFQFFKRGSLKSNLVENWSS